MKKVAYAILITAGLGMSAAAMAAVEAIKSGVLITSENCELLVDHVRLTLSTNVHGAYSCNEETNTIKIATCHKAGSRKPADIPCAVVYTDPEDDDPIYNSDECANPENQKFTISGYRAFIGSSTGGQVAATELGDSCDDDSVIGLGFFGE